MPPNPYSPPLASRSSSEPAVVFTGGVSTFRVCLHVIGAVGFAFATFLVSILMIGAIAERRRAGMSSEGAIELLLGGLLSAGCFAIFGMLFASIVVPAVYWLGFRRRQGQDAWTVRSMRRFASISGGVTAVGSTQLAMLPMFSRGGGLPEWIGTLLVSLLIGACGSLLTVAFCEPLRRRLRRDEACRAEMLAEATGEPAPCAGAAPR